MRRVLIGDLMILARCLAPLPSGQREEMALRLIQETHLADKYVKQYRRLHPKWGNGSLMGRCFEDAEPKTGAFTGDPEFYEALQAALAALIKWRGCQRVFGQKTP